MAIVTTIIAQTVFGDKRVVIGKCTNDSTGGAVATGLRVCDILIPLNLGGTAAELSVNSTFPVAGGSVTVVTENAVAFAFMAIGE